MKKDWFLGLSVVAGIIALVIIFTKISFSEVIAAFQFAPLWAIISYILILLAIMMTLAWRWQTIILSQNHPKPPLWHLFWYKIVGYGVSYVTPTAKIGGEPVRAGLLARHDIKYREALSTVIIDKTIELTSSGLFFVVGALVILSSFALPDETRTAIIIVSIAFFVVIFYFYYQMLNGNDFFAKLMRGLRLHKTEKGKRWEAKVKEFEELIITFYKDDWKYFLATMLISLLSWAFMFIEYKLALIILGYPESSMMQLFLIFSFVGIAYLVPIPMAVGSLEASQISVFAITGFKESAGVALAFLIRFKDILWAALAFVALSIYGLKISSTIKESGSVTKEVTRLKKVRDEKNEEKKAEDQ